MKASERDPNWRKKCYAQRFKTIDERFSEKYEINPVNGCWEWIGGTDADGYGLFQIKSKTTVRANRFALERKLGRPLDDGELACHDCDNPSCVNPDHIWAGNTSENQIDSTKKGRHRSVRLTPKHVHEIRQLWANGARVSELSRRFGMDVSSISGIIHRKKWRHLPESDETRSAYLRAKSEKRIPHNLGSKSWNARLTEENVRYIRSSNKRGVDLARELKVTPQMICGVRKGRSWRHVI